MLHVCAATSDSNLTHDLIRAALQESERPPAGGETILSKLSELMFLEALRRCTTHGSDRVALGTARPPHQSGLARCARAAAERWTIDALASEIGLSRSAFAERFAELMGVPPMQYLGNWRLQIATQLLEFNGMSIGQAAEAAGY